MTVPLDQFVCLVSENCPQNCTCIKRPSDLSFSVSCQPGTYHHLPEVLPNPDDPPPRIGRFHLTFTGSNIQTLEFRQYLKRTRWIDVSNSELRSIPDNVWRILSKIDHVDLSANQLTVLPTFLGYENITFRSLALYENPLRCNCENKWIRGWLRSLGSDLFVPHYQPPVVCGSPDRLQNRSILRVADEEFCRNPNSDIVLYIVEVC